MAYSEEEKATLICNISVEAEKALKALTLIRSVKENDGKGKYDPRYKGEIVSECILNFYKAFVEQNKTANQNETVNSEPEKQSTKPQNISNSRNTNDIVKKPKEYPSLVSLGISLEIQKYFADRGIQFFYGSIIDNFKRWYNEWGFNDKDIINAAEICMKNKGQLIPSYINGILKRQCSEQPRNNFHQQTPNNNYPQNGGYYGQQNYQPDPNNGYQRNGNYYGQQNYQPSQNNGYYNQNNNGYQQNNGYYNQQNCQPNPNNGYYGQNNQPQWNQPSFFNEPPKPTQSTQPTDPRQMDFSAFFSDTDDYKGGNR